jgi:hypothetical protein
VQFTFRAIATWRVTIVALAVSLMLVPTANAASIPTLTKAEAYTKARKLARQTAREAFDRADWAWSWRSTIYRAKRIDRRRIDVPAR